jgi:hypothetical protein
MKNIFFHRDFLAFALLLVIFKTAIDLRNPTIDNSIESSAYTHKIVCVQPEHIEPAPHHVAAAEPQPMAAEKIEVKREPFIAQELDNNLLKQIECAQAQVRQALDIAQPTSNETAQLYSLLQKLSQLHTEYQASIPKDAAPGPLATAAIALQEDDVKKELLNTVQKVAAILHTLAGNSHEPADSIIKELEVNHSILDKLTHV